MLYFLEVGLVLIVVPWSAYWDRNVFIESYPLIAPTLLDNFFRGAVSGLGLLNLWAGLSDLAWLLGERRDGHDTATGRLDGDLPVRPDGSAAKFPRPAAGG